ncbi:MAG: class I SAM-dependent methyltransferase [Erysipelotrichaceae bacterium]|nr:class I SAM-dependent methyltransferase [Erysipelotrichaceae bacterium]
MNDNLLTSVTGRVHHQLKQYLSGRGIAVDATVGRGNDTLFLCQNCRMVYGFDIQQEAIDSAEELLENNGCENFRLFCQGHEHLGDSVSEPLEAVMFNLGYLPGGRHEMTTVSETTMAALKASLKLLKKNGIIAVVMYSHPEGLREKDSIMKFVNELDPAAFHVLHLEMSNQPQAPEIIMIVRKKEK